MVNIDVVLDVKGMSCDHCKKAVHDALKDLSGIEHAHVYIDHGKVHVKYDHTVIDLETICEKIEEQGYEVVR